MPNPDDFDDESIFLDGVDDSIVALSNPVIGGIGEFERLGREWIFFERENLFHNPLLIDLRNFAQAFESGAAELDLVIHRTFQREDLPVSDVDSLQS
jgi:hypothetical protein